MTDNRKKKKELPVTGILMAVVIVLAICAVILGWMVQQREQQTKEQELQQKHTEEILKEGTVSEEDSGSKTKTETESETETETEPESESETASEETGSAAESEQETGQEAESEVGTKPDQATEPEKKKVVAIDPGHQGSWVNMSDQEPNGPGSSEMKAKATTGTQGRFSGKKEYELNLEVSLLLRTELENRGYEVILTREDHDTAISNAERALMAYEQGGDIYVRIHANGSDDSSVSGALAMVPSKDNPYVGALAEDSYVLADCILSSYCSKAGFSSLGIQYYDTMTGINWSKLPVMILEMGFMTNQSDDLRMADSSVQSLMAEGIADGIDQYFEKTQKNDDAVSSAAEEKMNALVERLEEEVIGPAREQGENWSLCVKNLETGAEGMIHGDQPMKSASVIKVFIMAAIYDRVCYPSSPERAVAFHESYEGELKQLITDMITVSDNTAANTLVERLGGGDAKAGMAIVNQFCEENGYTATNMGRKFLEADPDGDNYTSSEDCMRLLHSISSGTCVNSEASAKMLQYLKNQTRTGKIPSGLSGTGASVANKTGELAGDYGDYVENDIAIVEDDGGDFILCILSENLNDNGNAIERIKKISKMVYELR